MKMFDVPHKTFMEILKVNNKEVPFANLLAFFFRPNEKHGLKNLFIATLLLTKYSELAANFSKFENSLIDLNDTITGNIDDYIGNKVDVIVEQKTVSKENLLRPELNNKRIDILIIAENFVICIEFKINHVINNPLEEYKKFANEEYPNKKKYFIVLTPNRKEIKNNAINNTEFKQVVLSHFVENIKLNLPPNFKKNSTTNKYYDYFIDFIQTVENRKIKFLRYNFFESLNIALKIDKKIFCKIHNQNNGYLEIHKNKKILKLGFYDKNQELIDQNTGWRLENWNEKRNDLIELIDKKTTLEEIVEKINISLNK